MRLAQSDIAQSEACLKSEYLKVFVFKQNAALGHIWLSPNGLLPKWPSAALALPTNTFGYSLGRAALLAGHFGSNEVYDYL